MIIPMENCIFLRDSETKERIKRICEINSRVLLIVEDKHEECQYDLEDFRSLNIHENRVASRMIITRPIFFYLVRKGFLLPKNFDVCVIEIKKMNPAEISTFKIFYFYNNQDSSKCKVYTFLDEIGDLDCVYLQSKLYRDTGNSVTTEKPVRIIYCKSNVLIQHKSYIQLKKILDFPDPQNLEEISYKLIFKKILAQIKNDPKIAEKVQGYKEIPVDEEKLKIISLNNSRLKTLKDLLEKNSNKKIYVVCRRAILLNTLNFFNKHTEDIDIIIYFDHIETNIKAKQAIIFVDHNSDPNDVLNVSRKFNEDKETRLFFDHVENDSHEALRTEAGAYIEKASSHVILNRVLTNIKHMFEQHFFFLSSLVYSDAYVVQNVHFKCYMKLPEISDSILFTKQYISKIKPSKKEALHDVSMQILKKMIDDNCISKNLVPNIEYFILCDFYKSKMHTIYKFESELLIDFDQEYRRNSMRIKKLPFDYYLDVLNNENNLQKPKYFTKVYNWLFLLLRKFNKRNPEFILKIKFKQKYMITFKRENTIVMKSRAVPKCFGITDTLHLYSIKSTNLEIGILCGKTFTGSQEFDSTIYSYIGEYIPDENEFRKIALFNVVFFGINYKKRGMPSLYNYFVVPLKNGKVNAQKFIGDFYSNQRYTENLLFNPFKKTFLIFSEWIDKDMYDIPMQDDYCKDMKAENYEDIDLFEYFKLKYNIALNYTDKNAENLIYSAYLYHSKRTPSPQKYHFLTELTRVTPFTPEISTVFDKFKKTFVYFEVLALAEQAQKNLNLPISVNLISQCFMAKNENYPDYEQYEFLGDCIMKYIVTKFFVICYNEPTGTLVDTKCRVIENSNLTRIGRKHSLESYFSNLIFQPPSLIDPICKELQEYFKFSLLGSNPSVAINQELCAEKIYADIIEAIIGACYFENGIEVTEKLLFDLEIIQTEKYMLVDFEDSFQKKDKDESDTQKEPIDSFKLDIDSIIFSSDEALKIPKNNKLRKISPIDSEKDHQTVKFSLNDVDHRDDVNKENNITVKRTNKEKHIKFNIKKYLESYNNSSYLFSNEYIKSVSSYSGKMTLADIEKVEKILSYTFKHKGYLEKAMIHPSSNNNIFGTRQYFEKLELIGDSLLDVLVTDEIFSKQSCPYELHEVRKDLVNNQIYGNVLYDSCLYKYTQTCFSHDDLKANHQLNSYKKLYGDVFEAINGAILLDLNYDISKFKPIWENKIKNWLFDCYKIRQKSSNT